MNNNDQKYSTVFEIFYLNHQTFPFWIQPWKVTHSILKVKGWVAPDYGTPESDDYIHTIISDFSVGHFVADLYTPDKKNIQTLNRIVGTANLKCWLPA